MAKPRRRGNERADMDRCPFIAEDWYAAVEIDIEDLQASTANDLG